MQSEYLVHTGVKGMKWGKRKNYKSTVKSDLAGVESKYKSNVKSTRQQYKSGRQENKLRYKQSLGLSVSKYNDGVKRLAKKEGKRLTQNSQRSTAKAKAKGYAKVAASALVVAGTMTVSRGIKHPRASSGAKFIGGALAGMLGSSGLNDVANVMAYEGDTSALKLKNY